MNLVTDTAKPSPQFIIILIFLLVVIPVSIWIPSLSWGFTGDDFWLVPVTLKQFLANPFHDLGRPIWTLSNAIIPESAFLHRVFSLALYATIGGILASLVIRVSASVPAMMFVLGMLLHPSAIYSVSWIAQRNDLLVILFSLLAYGAYLERSAKPSSSTRIVIWQVLASASKTPYIFHNLVYAFYFFRNKKYRSVLVLMVVTVVFTVAGYLTHYLINTTARFADLQDFSLPVLLGIRALKILEGLVISLIPVPAFALSIGIMGLAFVGYVTVFSVGFEWQRIWTDLRSLKLSAAWMIAACLAVALAFDSSLRVIFPVVIFLAVALFPYIRTNKWGVSAAVILTLLNLSGTVLNYELFKSSCMTMQPCVDPHNQAANMPVEQYTIQRDEIRKKLLPH